MLLQWILAMTTTFKSHSSASSNLIESLASAISTLTLEDKEKLLSIIEQQIFEAEEESYAESAETIAEIQAARAAYEAGDYVTFDEYLANRSAQTT